MALKICPKCLSEINNVNQEKSDLGSCKTCTWKSMDWYLKPINLKSCYYYDHILDDMIQKLVLKRDEIFVKNLNRLVEGK